MFWALRVACMGFVALLTLLLLAPDPWAILGLLSHSPDVSIPNRGVHFVMFAALALLAHASRWAARLRPTVVVLVVYAIATELLQWFSPPRTVELADALENLAGILVGTLVFWAAGRFCEGRRGEAAGRRKSSLCGEIESP